MKAASLHDHFKNLLDLLGVVRFDSSRAVSKPAVVVCLDVRPAGLELISEIPEEVTLHVLGETGHGALAEGTNLLIRPESRVLRALSFLNCAILRHHSEGSIHFNSAVRDVNGSLSWEIRLRAVDPLALVLGVGVCIVEAAEPCGAHVSGERPFTDPDVVLYVVSVVKAVVVSLAVGVELFLVPPSLVEVGIKDDIFMVVVVEEIIPDPGVEVERIVEDEL